jgi:hypothetical protein
VSLARLAAFARDRRETCELCACALPGAHDHLVDAGGGIHCACATCERGDWRRVAPSVSRVACPSGEVWAGLGVPVGVAFVMRTSRGLVVRYPSPAGIAQGDPPAPAWDALVAELPDAAALAADVEAIVVDRRAAGAAYRVSIDHCYRLAGVLRARGDVDAWFAALAGACNA